MPVSPEPFGKGGGIYTLQVPPLALVFLHELRASPEHSLAPGLLLPMHHTQLFLPKATESPRKTRKQALLSLFLQPGPKN